MKSYLATRTSDGIRYAEKFEAESIEHAQSICLDRGWSYDGELFMEIPAGRTSMADMDALVNALNEGKTQ